MAQMVAEFKKLKATGSKERKNTALSWKYYINNEDEVIIPKINFNISTN